MPRERVAKSFMRQLTATKSCFLTVLLCAALVRLSTLCSMRSQVR